MIETRLHAVAQTLATIGIDYEKKIDGLKARSDLEEILRAYFILRTGYEAMEVERKKIGEMIERLSRGTIPEVMREKKVRNMALDDIERRFTLSARWSASMLDKDAAFQWLRDNGQEGIIQETVNAQTLAAFAKSYTEDTGKELPDNIFRVSLMDTTSMTKITASKNK